MKALCRNEELIKEIRHFTLGNYMDKILAVEVAKVFNVSKKAADVRIRQLKLGLDRPEDYTFSRGALDAIDEYWMKKRGLL